MSVDAYPTSPPRPPRPAEVNHAFRLWMVVTAVLAAAHGFLLVILGEKLWTAGGDGGSASPMRTSGVMILILIFLAFDALWVFLLVRMRAGGNGSRITLTVLGGYMAFGLISEVLDRVSDPDSIRTSALVATAVLGAMVAVTAAVVSAIYLMYRPAANIYYRRPAPPAGYWTPMPPGQV